MFKYTLHKKSIKHICPKCKKKRFVRYVSTVTNAYIASKVGRCDREISCGYHYTPKLFFNDNKQPYSAYVGNSAPSFSYKKKQDYHTVELLKSTLLNYDKNNFVKFLKSKFNLEKVNQMLRDYKIGTALNSYYGTIFWQIDENNNIRGGKIINYDNYGKRTKYINWVHAIKIKKKEITEFNLNQCLFGLHLMHRTTKTIAIVESEKTACIMNMLFHKYEWMATGSLNGLNEIKLKPIKDRPIILYPDLGIDNGNGSPFTQWKIKCEALNKVGFDIQVSDLLEKKASDFDREIGLDIADYFIDNPSPKPSKIKSNQEEIYLKLFMKNKNLKTLIDVFELKNSDNTDIRFE